jgi:hypothetical protein
MNSWKDSFERELQSAREIRATGNEGQARVCARRAAGIAIREYLLRRGYPRVPASAYELIEILQKLPDISPQIQQSSERLLMRVNISHRLPEDVDLIAEAVRLAAELGLDTTDPDYPK